LLYFSSAVPFFYLQNATAFLSFGRLVRVRPANRLFLCSLRSQIDISMGQSFKITAELNLLAPKNLRSVANQIHRTLNGGGSAATPTASSSSNQSASRQSLTQMRAQMQAVAATAAKTTKAVHQTSDSFASLSKNVGLATKRLLMFGTGAGVVITLANAFRRGIADGIEFQSEIVKIAQITSQSTKQLRGLSKEIHSLSSGLGSSSRGVLDAANMLSQAGLSAKDTKTALASLAKTDLAPTFDSISKTTEGAIAIFGQFGTSVDRLEGQLGSINAVSAKYAVESADLITAIKKSGGAFSQAGGSLNELLGIFASVRSKTREEAGAIANAMRTIFSRLQRTGTQKKLKDLLGIDLSDNGVFIGPMKAIQKLNMAMRDLPQGSLLAASAAETVGGIRQISKTLPMIKEFATAMEAAGVAEAGQNSLTRDVVTAQESLQVQINRTKETWKTFFDELVDDSGFKATISSLLELARGLASVANAIRPLIPAIAAMGALKLGSLAIPAIGRKIRGHNSGGFIFEGSGDKDDVPAMLSRGEYVLRSRVVAKIGKQRLDSLNFGNANPRKFRKGGFVGTANADVNEYGLAPNRLSPKIDQLISVIQQEVAATKADMAARKATQVGTYPVAPLPTTYPVGHVRGGQPSLRPHQTAGSIPLYANSFEENALAVVGGQPDEFQNRPYNLAGASSPVPRRQRQRVSLGRGHSRADREAFMADYKRQIRGNIPESQFGTYDESLSSIRRNRLQSGQAAYLQSIGYASPTTRGFSSSNLATRARGFGSAVGNRFAGLSPNMRNVGLGIGALGLSGQAENIGSHFGGDRGKSAVTGAVSGGALGATLGSVAGVPGAVVGGIVGSLAGIVQGLNAFDKELKSKAIEDGFKSIASSATSLASALEASHGMISGDVRKKAGTLFGNEIGNRGRIDAAQVDYAVARVGGLRGSVSDATAGYGDVFAGIGGMSMFGGKGYQATLEERQKQQTQLAQRAKNDLEVQNSSVDMSARESLKASLIKQSRVSGDFSKSDLGQSYIASEATRRTGLAKQRILADRPLEAGEGGSIHVKYTKEIEAEIAALERASMATKNNLNVIDAFTRGVRASSDSIGLLTASLSDLAASSQAMDNRQALITGVNGQSPATLHNTQLSSSISRFGSANFEQSASQLGRLSPSLAASSGLLVSANHAHGALREALPGLLNGSLDVGTDEGKKNFRSGIASSLSRKGVGGNVHENIMRSLDDAFNQPDFAKTFGSGTNNNKLSEKLLAWSKDIQSAEVEAAKAIEAQGARLSDAFGKLAGMSNDIIASRHATDENTLGGMRFVAERKASRFGGDVSSYLSVAQQQSPFVNNQQRLTGLSASDSLNPRAILAAASQSRQGMLAAQSRIEANPADGQAIADMRKFESQTQRAVSALKNLADASKLNASMQQRLAALDSDKSSRLGLAERFATANPQERMELNRNAMLTAHAAQAGSLDKFSDPDKKGILDFLNSAGGTRLFGGEQTGEGLKKQLLENSFGGMFRQNAKDRNESEGLENGIAGNHERATTAQAGLTSLLESTQRDFFNNLSDNQRQFLQSLNGVMGSDKPIEFNPTVPEAQKRAAPVQDSTTPSGLTVPAMQAEPQAATPTLTPRQQRLGIQAKIRENRERIRQNGGEAVGNGNLIRQADGSSKRLSAVDEIKNLKGQIDSNTNPKRAAYDAARKSRKDAYETKRSGRQQAYENRGGGDAQALSGPVNTFAQASSDLGKSIASIPHTIELNGSVKHEIVLNGAEVLAKISPEIMSLVSAGAKSYVDSKLSKLLPELGVNAIA
jgi:TP901 family phage tail tape measure protein